MATGRSSTKKVGQQPISQDELPILKAAEFARLSRQTGWRLAWLVASSCEKANQGKRTDLADNSQVADLADNSQVSAKVSMNQFAKLAGKSRFTVQFYYKAWNHAYEDGTVPCAAEDVPSDVEWVEGQMMPPDEFRLDDDDLAHPWTFYFDWAKNGQRPNPKRYDDDSEDEDETPEVKGDEKKPVADVEQADDESDSLDEDFGLPDAMSEDEVAEADSSIQREMLAETLETLRAIIDRVSNVGEITGDNDALLGQIASAALDLNGVANAMAAKAEVEEAA